VNLTTKAPGTRRRTNRTLYKALFVTNVSSLVPLAAGVLMIATSGCGWSGKTASAQHLLPVSLPDLSRVYPAVQAQVRERYAALQQISHSATADELGAAYGGFGMVLHAAEFYEAAEPCYLNAQTLMPAEPRWPYYLARLHNSKGEIDKAEASFKQVLALRPDDLPALIWLGRLYLDTDRPADAHVLFTKAFTLAPRTVAVLAGLGRAALAQKDYARAVKHFEDALAIDPGSESLHAPLAMAYRGLGELDKAAPHAQQWRNTDILVSDPLQQELYLLLESGLSYERRGGRALELRDWPAAAGFFRKGLALTQENTPLRRSLQHKLGTALYLSGDARGAEEQFEAVVGAEPTNGVDESAARAHFSLGVVRALRGRSQEAIDHFLAAVKYQPTYVEAQQALADALRRAGRADAALAHYNEALKINPRLLPARLGYAMALARLGRDREARDWLDESIRLHPDQSTFQHALARVLSASPDDRVRDGRRAMAIVQELFKRERATSLGETMAMTYAELGDYRQAAAIQRGVLASARQGGLESDVRRIIANLQRYERGQPCRVPWTDDEEVSLPTQAIH
jgi:tetratricopeptide (TPR) repeat protein